MELFGASLMPFGRAIVDLVVDCLAKGRLADDTEAEKLGLAMDAGRGVMDGRCSDALTVRLVGVGLTGLTEVRFPGWMVGMALLTGDTGLDAGLAMLPLLVTGLLAIPRAEIGRLGGPIGL